jgi:hypothetical protein
MPAQPTHHMQVEVDDGHDIIFACPEADCGRRFLLRRSGGYMVLDRGDVNVRHVGGTGPVSLSVDVGL